MYCIISDTNDPFFNLATEEYLMKNTQEDISMLWQSEPCVVVGKHQNTYAEINYHFIRENNIKVARRLSGGGTVFHDHGNLNFTFIRNGEPGKLVDFKRFVSPVIEMLQQLTINATIGGKNDILIDGKKISGNAEHVYKNRVLHHGTLLFSSDLENLGDAIRVKPGRYFDKAVQSNRSRVMNISEKLTEKIDISEFKEKLNDFILNKFPTAKSYFPRKEDLDKIAELAKEKYATWEWVYGYSPDYYLQDTFETEKGSISFRLNVSRGKITGCELEGEVLTPEEKKSISEKMTGLYHRETELSGALNALSDRISLTSAETDEFIKVLF